MQFGDPFMNIMKERISNLEIAFCFITSEIFYGGKIIIATVFKITGFKLKRFLK